MILNKSHVLPSQIIDTLLDANKNAAKVAYVPKWKLHLINERSAHEDAAKISRHRELMERPPAPLHRIGVSTK